MCEKVMMSAHEKTNKLGGMKDWITCTIIIYVCLKSSSKAW